jgi:energy-coupling factor transport system ATP-binding protein
VLVLDEPTTGQDGPGVARVGSIVDALRAAGRTVIAITHDMEFAAAHFERIVVMRQGEVIADGSPAEVFAPGNEDLLASTGLEPPIAARIGARLGLGSTPTLPTLLEALAGHGPR